MAYNDTVVLKETSVRDLPIGSKLKLSNGMTFILSVFDVARGTAVFLSEHILENVPWATGDNLIKPQDADVNTVTLKKYYSSLSLEDKLVLRRNGFTNFSSPVIDYLRDISIEYRIKRRPKYKPDAPERMPEDYWTGTVRERKLTPEVSNDPSPRWEQRVMCVDDSGNFYEEVVFITGHGYAETQRGVVAAFSVESVTNVKFESGYWTFVGESFEIPDIIV